MIEVPQIYMLTAAVLIAIGMYATLAGSNVLRKLLGINLFGNGTFLLLIAIAQRAKEDAAPDPVPQAMVLTGIVVAVCATAFALALIERYHKLTKTLHLDKQDTDD